MTVGNVGNAAGAGSSGGQAGDRGSCSADSGVRGSSDRESGGATSVGGNLSDSTTDGKGYSCFFLLLPASTINQGMVTRSANFIRFLERLVFEVTSRQIR